MEGNYGIKKRQKPEAVARKIVSFLTVVAAAAVVMVKISQKSVTARKVSKYGDFSGPYFPVFGLNTEIYGVKKTPYLDTFHAVKNQYSDIFQRVRAMKTIFNCLLLTL